MNRLFYLAATFCLLAALIPAATTLADEPAAAAEKPSAVELVEAVVEQVGKIDAVNSLYLRFEITVTRPPELIAELAAANEIRKQTAKEVASSSLPAQQRRKTLARLKSEITPDPRPESTEELVLAFDENRASKVLRVKGEYQETTVYDGTQAVRHTSYIGGRAEEIERADSPQQLLKHFFVGLAWQNVAPHAFWFQEDRLAATRPRIAGYAQDYVLVGDADFHGVPCYCLENRAALKRLHVGRLDHRLHGVTLFVVDQPIDPLQAAAAAAGRTFANEVELTSWLKLLSAGDREAYEVALRAARFAAARPHVEYFLDQYREIAPGFWFPARQESVSLRAARTVTRLVDAKVDAALPDDLFAIPSPETK